MASKIKAAITAVQEGSNCRACIIASGYDHDSIRSIFSSKYDPKFGEPKGTLFLTPGSDLEAQAIQENMMEEEAKESCSNATRQKAIAARDQARKLQNLSYPERQTILNAVADAIVFHKDALLAANA
eukprot:CAMPEP_0172492344 /NCGR_PEP_ID=MMETSP1066-20121228/23458_1 /TAXON_ID=671091 /ORGANISM="Coscinodiscus wailesii, Strain CCMP2513" /LENGTH=126 /DNA_ID=CAMNT_0013261905 /DNA_START=52 /DNA_END=428 /DNA_ORIENTATION=+